MAVVPGAGARTADLGSTRAQFEAAIRPVLPRLYRYCLSLCGERDRADDLGYDEVSEMLGIPKGTVKSRHARGRARLREAYERLTAPSADPAREESI